jgi:hypothetical protein
MAGAKVIPMNFRHALGFFAVGAVLALIPRLAPGLVESAGVDGSSTQTIWLQIMSFVLMGIGVSHFAQRTLVGLASLLEYAPQSAFARATEARPAVPALRPVVATAPALSPIRAAFKGGLMDQRRAA